MMKAEQARLLACVHCGFCLTACPTYNRLGDEADSPRGRLHLMRAVAESRLEPSAPAFRAHIDRCLGCRACEPVCPSGVQYGYLVERARTAAVQAGGRDPLGRLLLLAFGSRLPARVVGWGGRLLRAGGLAALLRRLLPRGAGRLRFGLAMLAATRSWSGLRALPGVPAGADAAAGQIPGGRVTGCGRSFLPAAAEARPPRVAMLQGCVQEALYARVNRATERVLRAAGCELVAVPGQECCGALHAHSGALGGAHELARANILAFERAGIDHVVVNAAGCGAMMKEYGEQLGEDPEWSERAHAFARKVRDLNELLLELELPPGGAVDLKVTYDAPCHLHHAQRITRAPVELVGRIPGVRYVALRQADECCGGAGIYGVTHPELGGRILADKIDAVLETGADVVVTPNPGCMMQIGAGLLQRGSAVRVLHPIELLDESFRRAGLYS